MIVNSEWHKSTPSKYPTPSPTVTMDDGQQCYQYVGYFYLFKDYGVQNSSSFRGCNGTWPQPHHNGQVWWFTIMILTSILSVWLFTLVQYDHHNRPLPELRAVSFTHPCYFKLPKNCIITTFLLAREFGTSLTESKVPKFKQSVTKKCDKKCNKKV